MDNKIDRIEHEGIVEEVSKENLIVNILQQSGCLSCAVKGACNVSESETKQVEVTRFVGHYIKGERVNIFYERSLGFKALFLGYVLPFLVLFVILLIGKYFTGNESLAGLIALFSLIPYYAVLYLLRDKLKKEFTFRVEKLVEEPLSLKNVNLNH